MTTFWLSGILNFFLHNMFRPSGPDHVLAKTATIQGKPHRKWMWGLSQIKTNNMAEKVKVTALYIRKLQHCFLKGEPLRGMTVPPLLVLEPLLAKISLFLEPPSFARAGQAPRKWGAWQHTWSWSWPLLYWNEDPPSWWQDCIDDDLPLQALLVVVDHLATKTA